MRPAMRGVLAPFARLPWGHVVRLEDAPPGPHIRTMSDHFVQPEEPSAAAAIATIGEELDVFDDWMDRYQFIIEMGRKLPPFPDTWADDAHRVPGCQSRA